MESSTGSGSSARQTSSLTSRRPSGALLLPIFLSLILPLILIGCCGMCAPSMHPTMGLTAVAQHMLSAEVLRQLSCCSLQLGCDGHWGILACTNLRLLAAPSMKHIHA